jgi:hypothetical protein
MTANRRRHAVRVINGAVRAPSGQKKRHAALTVTGRGLSGHQFVAAVAGIAANSSMLPKRAETADSMKIQRFAWRAI